MKMCTYVRYTPVGKKYNFSNGSSTNHLDYYIINICAHKWRMCAYNVVMRSPRSVWFWFLSSHFLCKSGTWSQRFACIRYNTWFFYYYLIANDQRLRVLCIFCFFRDLFKLCETSARRRIDVPIYIHQIENVHAYRIIIAM